MDHRLLEVLQATELFGGMEKTSLLEILPALKPVSVAAGERLISEGEIGDCCYFLLRGRLSVVINADTNPICVGEIGHGEIVGELALLSEAPRSATVFALRDCDLVSMDKETFTRLFEFNPGQLLNIARLLARRTQERQKHAHGQRPPVRIAFMFPPEHSINAAELVQRIAKAFAVKRENLVVSSEDIAGALAGANLLSADRHSQRRYIGQWLEARDDDCTILLFPTYARHMDEAQQNLLEAMLLEADRIVFLAETQATSESLEVFWQFLQQHPSLARTRKDLALLRPQREQPPLNTAQWLQCYSVDRVYHLAQDSESSLQRMARRIMGDGVGLVLGGGGARGFAHVGVFKAYEEAGIDIDMVGGTSIGSVIGMLKAMDLDAAYIAQVVKKYFEDDPTNDYTIPFISIITGRKIDTRLKHFFGDRLLEDMPIPGFAVATNLTRSAPMVLERGLIHRAVRASLAIPGVLPPMTLNGDILVDGGVSNNLPVNIMRERFSGQITAVDVASGYSLKVLNDILDRPLKRSDWLISRLRRIGNGVRPPGLAEVLLSVGSYAGINSDNAGKADADLLISPNLKSFGLLDWGKFDTLVELGYRATMEALEASDKAAEA